MFVESAGRPNVIAGTDRGRCLGIDPDPRPDRPVAPRDAHQPCPQPPAHRQIGAAYAAGRANVAVRLERKRAQIDDRFDPRQALAATVRYLQLAERHFGRADLAVVSYHMGIGNLQQVLDDYDGGHPVPYTQLYFDTAPDHAAAAYDLLSGFGDDSSLYYWRVLGAVQIMHLYRTDRQALARLSALQLAADTNAVVLHPPDATTSFADPNALYDGYHSGALVRLPADPRRLGLAYSRSIGSLASSLHVPAALYYGLRPAALDMLVELAARVRALSGGSAPLVLGSAVLDGQYAQQVANPYTGATTGYAFQIFRRYVSRAQALAFQAMLDRLAALNLIAWERRPETIDITVASDASHAIVDGP